MLSHYQVPLTSRIAHQLPNLNVNEVLIAHKETKATSLVGDMN